MTHPSGKHFKKQRPPLVRTTPSDAACPERSQTIIDQLASLQYDCASCLAIIAHDVATWACKECFRIFHLYCIKQWAKQDGSGSGMSFRCPHCQTMHATVHKYVCFCGKVRDPLYDPYITPHSCGQTCGKKRGFCEHPCPLQCHPGPCSDCGSILGPRNCPCGSSTYTWRCGFPDPKKTCDNTCSKQLNCGLHKCEQTCHWGDCDPCSKTIQVTCFCGCETVDLPCGSTEYSCGNVCGKKLRCDLHTCDMLCHSGPCPPCPKDPTATSTCPCGSVPLNIVRNHCTDPIPTCNNMCGRLLDCNRHNCNRVCHDGPCGACDLRSLSRCVCGQTQLSLPCKEQDGYRCDKICKTRMTCGKHECRVKCCSARKKTSDSAHICDRICNKKLSCGHACTDRCHRGLCLPCTNVIAERLFCHCGAQMLMPPQPCGTPPPKCNRPCTLTPSCGHSQPQHNCHFGDCPPCTFPVEKECAGGHMIVGNVPCSAEYATCNNKCNKPLMCGHECSRLCHTGDCVNENHPCLQLCGMFHDCCGHSCKAKCHASRACPPCSEKVERRCECGRQVQLVSCKKLIEFLRDSTKKIPVLKCNADCLFEQRLMILANRGRVSALPPPVTKYSLFLWDLALKNPDWVRKVEKHLENFVKGDDALKCLPPMSSEKRALIHSLSQYYHIRSEGVDSEADRSCLLTRTSKTQLPNTLLSEAVTQPDKHDPKKFIEEIGVEWHNKRAIYMQGDIVNEIFVSRVLQDYAGEFVCGNVEFLASGMKEIKVFFTDQTRQQQAYSYLCRTKPPFRFFIPSKKNEENDKKFNNAPTKSWAKLVSSSP